MMSCRTFRFAVGIVFLLTQSGCGTSASPNLRDSMTRFDATVDAGMDAHADVLDATTTDTERSELLDVVADVVSVDAADAASDIDVIDVADTFVGRDVADVPPTDAECTPAAATRQCRLLLGITQDPQAGFACCEGRCSSMGCGVGGGCGGRPCNAHAGELCCVRRFTNVAHCVPRDQGLCTYTP